MKKYESFQHSKVSLLICSKVVKIAIEKVCSFRIFSKNSCDNCSQINNIEKLAFSWKLVCVFLFECFENVFSPMNHGGNIFFARNAKLNALKRA